MCVCVCVCDSAPPTECSICCRPSRKPSDHLRERRGWMERDGKREEGKETVLAWTCGSLMEEAAETRTCRYLLSSSPDLGSRSCLAKQPQGQGDGGRVFRVGFLAGTRAGIHTLPHPSPTYIAHNAPATVWSAAGTVEGHALKAQSIDVNETPFSRALALAEPGQSCPPPCRGSQRLGRCLQKQVERRPSWRARPVRRPQYPPAGISRAA